MMHFDVTLTQGAVYLGKVEIAHRALKGLPEFACLGDLTFAQCRIPFAKGGPAGQEAPFGSRDPVLVHFVRLLRDESELTRGDPVFDGLSCEQHLCLVFHERFGDESGQSAALGGRTRVVGAARDQICALATDAGSRPESGHVACRVPVERQGAEKVGELVCGLLIRPELAPVVVHDA